MENILKAMWFDEVEVKDPDTGAATQMVMYKTETGWVFGLDASYVATQDGVLDDDELVELGVAPDRLDIVFAIYSPIDKNTIILCDEPLV